MTKVLIVCMGNICRSPTAEAVLRSKAQQRGLRLEVDSAGTLDYHQGEAPDPRAQQAAQARGYSMAGITARQVTQKDFAYFDLILAADRHNFSDLALLCPEEYRDKVSLMLSHSHLATQQIPDPYYGGQKGFEDMLDLIEQGADQLLDKLAL